MARLPEVLAGPIVRRSTPEEVNVWLATSVPLADPELLLRDAQNGVPIPGVSSYRSVRLGVQLHVHMLTVRSPDDPFPVSTPIAYDIVGSAIPLRDMMNLRSLTLPDMDLPTFVLQPSGIRQLHALYASCRKLHGPAPDMMRAAAHILKNLPAGRPEVLFLGGDQIYADDVDGKLIGHINRLGNELVGYQEFIKGLAPAAHSPEIDRGKFLKRWFSSGEMNHHLLTFGEYAATYLFAWNPELWKRTVVGGGAQPAIPAHDASFGAAASRLVLANIVTYMTFDDHEITDDWFLNQEWRRKAMSNEPAKRIIVNGLCAYWAFQGWGNDPHAYPDDFLDAVQNYTQDGSDLSKAMRLLLLTGPGWSYIAPTSPPTLVLDTRTGRAASKPFRDKHPGHSRDTSLAYLKYGIEPGPVSTVRNTDAPRLLDETERARLSALTRPVSPPLIVIAPSPIFGFRPIEEVQELVGGFSPAAGDLESWAANPRNITDFVHLLFTSDIDQAIVLSGDVHYAFEMAVTISNGSSTVRVAQFCSSALKNRPTGNQLRAAKLLSHAGLRKRAVAWWSFGDDDGPVVRSHAVKGQVFSKLVKDHGDPTFVIAEHLKERDGGAVILKNNIGELFVDGTEISHRFWLPSGGTFTPTEFTQWRPDSWPAPRVWL